jgi:asparagine synthase (glutamine-hydrolysing)
MCGIVGVLGPTAADADLLDRLVGHVSHRGPDARGTWSDPRGAAALGHARLAVLGLGAAGAQPMTSASGRYVVTYNGELYEHLDLRHELDTARRAPLWRGTSDTETLLACFDAWGIGATLPRLIGMFAFGVWDRERDELTLVRDRLGEKPLHYARIGATVVFASELAAVVAHPAVPETLDRDAAALLLRFGRVPSPRTILEGVRKLPAGCALTLRADGPTMTGRDQAEAADEPVPYWSLDAVIAAGRRDRLDVDHHEAATLLEDALRRAVTAQTLSEVPLGAFLSGGVDSSTVVALMADSGQRIRTFTVGFDDPRFDEAPLAREVARHLGTDHHELRLTEQDVLAAVPDLPGVYGEPFADASALPTLLLSRFARHDVTVCLTGDGGDELLGGYLRYARALRLERIPAVLRHAGSAVLRGVPVRAWDGLLGAADAVRGRRGDTDPGRASAAVTGHRMHVLAGMLARPDAASRYLDLASVAVGSDQLIHGAHPPLADPDLRATWDRLAHLAPLERMTALDLLTYLPDDILHKVDRAAMSVALETRVPLLDHRIVELVWRLPPEVRFGGGRPKALLRQVAGRRLPAALLDRPKAGFAVPLAAWLRGPLRGWAEDLLSAGALADAGLVDVAAVRATWEEHLAGRRERHNELWPVLMLHAWLASERRARG